MMVFNWLKENKFLLFFFVILLLLNVYIFYGLQISKEPDLMVKDVSYTEEEGWQVTVMSTLEQPGRQAQVEIIFHDGRVSTEEWSLDQAVMSWNFPPGDSAIEYVRIRGPLDVDRLKENSDYFNNLWSKNVMLKSLPLSSDFTNLVGNKGDLYLAYSLHDLASKQYQVYLEKRSPTGEMQLGPLEIGSGPGSMETSPLFVIPGNGGDELALLAWNSFLADNYSASLVAVELPGADGQSPKIEEIMLEDTRDDQLSQVRILAVVSGREWVNEGGNTTWYVLAALQQQGNSFLKLYQYDGVEQIKSLVLTPLPVPPAAVRRGEVIPGQEAFNIFWVRKKEWNYQLEFMKVAADGEILLPVKDVAEVRIDFSIPDALQIIAVPGSGFHVAWMETTERYRMQLINYLIMDEEGNLTKKIPRFVETGGYCPGFDLGITPANNIEMFYPIYEGHMIYQNQKNTEVFQSKFSTDLEQIQPVERIVSSTYYDNYPSLSYYAGERYLFWLHDRKEMKELMYATTNPAVKRELTGLTLQDLKQFLINNLVSFIYYSVLGIIFVALISILPLLGLLLYNRLGRYKKNNFFYWLTGLLFMFVLKIYFEAVYLTWSSPLLHRVYQLNLVFLGLVVAALVIYWVYANRKNRQYRSIFLNKMIAGWFVLDYFLAYMIFIRKMMF